MATEIQKVELLWNAWDIRVFLIFSLAIQILLTFLAPLRKRCSSGLLSFCIWMMYLSAEAVALLSIGFISCNLGEASHNSELLAFWAPFLLLHLGGPDTITALALEDNELWLRHALQLATQACVTIFVFCRSVQKNNQLWAPTLLMFVNGTLKYTERTCALYFASSPSFKDSLATNNEAWFDSTFPQSTEVSETNIVSYAYTSYRLFKGILVDSALTLETRDSTRAFFLSISPQYALSIIEIELNLINDVFFTKVSLLLQRKGVYLLLSVRAVSFLSVVVSLLLFIVKDSSKYHKTDVGITYCLLIGALLLDLCAGLRFVASDWWSILVVPTLGDWSLLESIPRRLHNLVATSQKWSQSISQFNLFERSKSPEDSKYFKYIFIKRIKDVLIGWVYVQSVPINKKLVDFITEEMQNKVRQAIEVGDAADEIRSARGNLVFHQEEILKPWTVDLDYYESLLIWHLATDICLREDIGNWLSESNDAVGEALYYQLSKQLSNYMLYILIKQPVVSSVTGFSDIRFEVMVNLCHSMMEKLVCIRNRFPLKSKAHYISILHRFSTLLLTETANYDLADLDCDGVRLLDDRTNVLSKASELAKKIDKFGTKKWEITSKVWVELLCYAAIRSSPRSQVALLNEGGELITIVWLLLAHLGLACQFQLFNRKTMLREAAAAKVNNYEHAVAWDIAYQKFMQDNYL